MSAASVRPPLAQVAFPGLLLATATAATLGRISLALAVVVAWVVSTGPATYWTIEALCARPLALVAGLSVLIAGLGALACGIL